MPDCDKWYGTMPMGCMIVWAIETTDHEEVKATEALKAQKKKEKERKKTKERAEKKGKECGTTGTPTH
jgi:hypothetical protein